MIGRMNFLLLSILASSLAFSFNVRADITLTSVTTPAIVGQPVTFQGTSTCDSVYLVPGDGNSGGSFPVIAGNYTVNYSYSAPDSFPFTLIELLDCGFGTSAGTIDQVINVTGGSGGSGGGSSISTTGFSNNLNIRRIEIYFTNRQSKITVHKNQPLKAHARILYTGSGVIRGHWEVDGRIHSQLNEHLSTAQSIELDMPGFPTLPTYRSGAHKIRLVLTSPVLSQSPVALYFVKSDTQLTLQLLSPLNDQQLEKNTFSFDWSPIAGVKYYQLDIVESANDKPLFSAQSKSSHYLLNQLIIDRVFGQTQNLQWKVSAFDRRNQLIGISEYWRLTFKTAEDFINNQILIIVEDNVKGKRAIKLVEQKYQLNAVQHFSLLSLTHRVSVYQVQQDMINLIARIKMEPGIVDTQPNYISRVMGEPRTGLQRLSKTLEFQKLHQQHTGKDVQVAIIDTGVDTRHKDLQDNIKAFHNFIYKDSYQNEIHGSAVAGIIAAATNNFGIQGIAPEANIIALRACRQLQKNKATAVCYSSSLAKALDKAIQIKTSLVNMSFGAAQYDPLLARLISAGRKQSMIFVAPVGNALEQKELSFPASHPQVISVAGLDDNNHAFPNQTLANQADTIAPSSQLFTTVPDNKHNFIDGTSMSSAVISGLLVLAIEKQGSFQPKNLPQKTLDLCAWQEELLNIGICP